MGGYIAQELPSTTRHCKKFDFGLLLARGREGCAHELRETKEIHCNDGLPPEQILRKDMDIYFSDKFITEHPEKISEFIEISLRYYQPPDALRGNLPHA